MEERSGAEELALLSVAPLEPRDFLAPGQRVGACPGPFTERCSGLRVAPAT